MDDITNSRTGKTECWESAAESEIESIINMSMQQLFDFFLKKHFIDGDGDSGDDGGGEAGLGRVVTDHLLHLW